jgi:hypothetical protein
MSLARGMGGESDFSVLQKVQGGRRSAFGKDDLAWFESDIVGLYGYTFDSR